MSFLDQLAAFLAQLFGQKQTQDGGASVPTSTVIYPDKPNPGTLWGEAPAHYPDPLQLLSFGLYGPDVSGTPNYPTSAVPGGPAASTWQDRVNAFLNRLGGAFTGTVAPGPTVVPLAPITSTTPPTQTTGSGDNVGGFGNDIFSPPPPPPPPPPPVIGSYGGSSGGVIVTTQSHNSNIQKL